MFLLKNFDLKCQISKRRGWGRSSPISSGCGSLNKESFDAAAQRVIEEEEGIPRIAWGFTAQNMKWDS